MRHKPCLNRHKSCVFKEDDMTSDAAVAYDLVTRAMEPLQAHESKKARLRTAAQRLGRHGLDKPHSKVWRAWQRRAGAPTRNAIEAAFDKWQDSRLTEADKKLRRRMASLLEALNETDPEFHRVAVDALGESLRRAGIKVPQRSDTD